MDHETESLITIRKRRISPEQRMAAKALLLAHFPGMLQGGQLILHFGPGRVPIYIEAQERRDTQKQGTDAVWF